jgi:hypothetical protein
MQIMKKAHTLLKAFMLIERKLAIETETVKRTPKAHAQEEGQ